MPVGALADHELLEGAPAGGRADPGAHGVVAHRQHSRAHADRLVQARERRRRREAVLGAHPRALQAPREVAVAEVEPHLRAELAQRVHHREGVAAQAPAALVDQVGEPEGDEVGVGGDVRAVDLDVVAGVRDHGEPRGLDDVEHAPRELGAAGAAGEDDDICRFQSLPRVRRAAPSRRMPGVGLVARVDRDQQRRERLGDARHLQAAAVDAAQALDPLDQRAASRLSARESPHRSTSCSSGCSRSAERGGADRVQGGDHAHALGRHLGACWAAEPCHTPSMRVALPLTAAASGTVASISSWPGAARP